MTAAGAYVGNFGLSEGNSRIPEGTLKRQNRPALEAGERESTCQRMGWLPLPWGSL
jgi:hypothetical protein